MTATITRRSMRSRMRFAKSKSFYCKLNDAIEKANDAEGKFIKKRQLVRIVFNQFDASCF